MIGKTGDAHVTHVLAQNFSGVSGIVHTHESFSFLVSGSQGNRRPSLCASCPRP